ncbi:MAG: hypothetical protein E6K49_07770, partial [Gammaproteobacteria bacterium]
MQVFKTSPASRKRPSRARASTNRRASRAQRQSEQTAQKLNGESGAILAALLALAHGKRDVRLPERWHGQAGRIAEAFNEVVQLNVRMAG